MKFRIHGLPEEVDEAVKRLHGIFTVVSVSAPYPGPESIRLVRVYVEVRL